MLPPKIIHRQQIYAHGEGIPFEKQRVMARNQTIRSLHESNNNNEYQHSNGKMYRNDGLVLSQSLRQRDGRNVRQDSGQLWFGNKPLPKNYTQRTIVKKTRALNPAPVFYTNNTKSYDAVDRAPYNNNISYGETGRSVSSQSAYYHSNNNTIMYGDDRPISSQSAYNNNNYVHGVPSRSISSHPTFYHDNNNTMYGVVNRPTSSRTYSSNSRNTGAANRPMSSQSSYNHSSTPHSYPVVEGKGIKEGTAGQPVLFTLDGRNAGPGQLSCRCRAPSGSMTYVLISDNKDGTYTVDLNASEPGLHTVEVEWDGQPIPGSPFLVRITQAPDMKKVRAQGPGLEPGVLSTFRGLFQVDSKGAGPGTMKVRIHGPKGAFKVEMFRDHPKDRSINVRYNPTEPGIYTANVYWSDEHIQGSPFEILVAKNEQELREWQNSSDRMRKTDMNAY